MSWAPWELWIASASVFVTRLLVICPYDPPKLKIPAPETRSTVTWSTTKRVARLMKTPAFSQSFPRLTASGDVTLTPRSSGPAPIMITAE